MKRRTKPSEELATRNAELVAYAEHHPEASLAEIGREFNLSGDRARNIIRLALRKEAREERMQKMYG